MSKRRRKSEIITDDEVRASLEEERVIEAEAGKGLAPVVIQRLVPRRDGAHGRVTVDSQADSLTPLMFAEKETPAAVDAENDNADADADTGTDATATATDADADAMAGREEGARPSADDPDAYAGEDETGFDSTLSLPPELADKVDAGILTSTPFLDPLQNETYCYLVPRDPRTIYAIWEVGQATREHLQAAHGNAFFDRHHLILRLYQVTGIVFDGFNANAVFEKSDWLDDKNEYWLEVIGDNDYLAEIGYRSNDGNDFEVVARSNVIRVPKGYPTEREAYAGGNEVEVDGNAVEVPVREDEWRFNQYYYWKERTHAAPDEKGCWALVLHQHLPFVRHPEYRVSLEEQWYFEAVLAVYTQIINMFWRLERDKVDFRVTVSLTPPLLSMMQDPLLQQRAARHIDQCIRLATRERDNSHGMPYHDTAEQILHRFWIAKEVFEAYDGDLTRGYRDFQDMGKVEVITCPATHMILPLFAHHPEIVRGQIQLACRQYERAFGRWPRGMWLPENAFTPGIDRFLVDEGIKWCLLDATALAEADTRSHHGTNAPIITPNGLACFGIDEETRAQVWSREGGYPGHENYKEWYRDLGYDADWDYLPDYFKTANVRRNTGIKYYRITEKGCDLGGKDYYKPLWAEGTVHEQAGQFVYYRGVKANYVRDTDAITACTVSAYDAELFGHWWEEGPAWLESVFRKMCFDQQEVRPVTPSEYLAEHPRHQQLMPGASSWGKKNYFQTWVDGREYQPNCWVFRHYYRLCGRMTDLATRFKGCEDALMVRALNQAAREMCLAVASDWGFLIETGQAVRYSELQIIAHIDRAKELMRQVQEGRINETYLLTLEAADNFMAWDEMDFRVFCRE